MNRLNRHYVFRYANEQPEPRRKDQPMREPIPCHPNDGERLNISQLATLVRPPTLHAFLPMLNTERLLPHLGMQPWLDYPGQPRPLLPFPTAFLHSLVGDEPVVLPGPIREILALACVAAQHITRIESIIEYIEGSKDNWEDSENGDLDDLSLAVTNHLLRFSPELKIADESVFDRMTQSPMAALITANSHLRSDRHWRRIRERVEGHPEYVFALLGLRHLPKQVFPESWFLENTRSHPLYWILAQWTAMPCNRTEEHNWTQLVRRAVDDPSAAAVALTMAPNHPQARRWLAAVVPQPRLALEVAHLLHRWADSDLWQALVSFLKAASLSDARCAFHWFRDIEPVSPSIALSALSPALEWMVQYAVDANLHPKLLLRAMDALKSHPLEPQIRHWIHRQLDRT